MVFEFSFLCSNFCDFKTCRWLQISLAISSVFRFDQDRFFYPRNLASSGKFRDFLRVAVSNFGFVVFDVHMSFLFEFCICDFAGCFEFTYDFSVSILIM